MKVYIVHKDVPYEFGEVIAVFDSQDKALQFVNENKDSISYEYLSVEEREVR